MLLFAVRRSFGVVHWFQSSSGLSTGCYTPDRGQANAQVLVSILIRPFDRMLLPCLVFLPDFREPPAAVLEISVFQAFLSMFFALCSATGANLGADSAVAPGSRQITRWGGDGRRAEGPAWTLPFRERDWGRIGSPVPSPRRGGCGRAGAWGSGRPPGPGRAGCA